MQMIGHILLTMINSVYLIADPTMFQEKNRRRIEVANDVTLMLVSVLTQYFLTMPEPDEKEQLGDVTLGALALLFVINIAYIVTVIRDGIVESKRKKMLKRKESYDATV